MKVALNDSEFKEHSDILLDISRYKSMLRDIGSKYNPDVIKILIEEDLERNTEKLSLRVRRFLDEKEFSILSQNITDNSISMYIQTDKGLSEILIDLSIFDDSIFKIAKKMYKEIRSKNLSFLNNKDMIEFITSMEDDAKKGAYIQRYKGLGEMNADQLWETTMMPNNRNLLQLKINDEQTTDGIFSVFMGDDVEPRRLYIQEHAKSVRNLDI